jgi:hypothetical protein
VYGNGAAHRDKYQEIDMLKKTTASVGLAVAASAGVLLFTGPPASAQTVPASAQTSTAYVQTTGTSNERHWSDHRDGTWGHRSYHHRDAYWRHHRHHGHHRHYGPGHHHTGWSQHHRGDATTHQVVISSTTIKVST